MSGDCSTWGGFALPRAGMVADNRKGDLLIFRYEVGDFELLRDLDRFESAAFVARYPSAVRWIMRDDQCAINMADPEFALRAKDHVLRRKNGSLYMLRNVPAANAYRVFAETHAANKSRLVLSIDADAESVAEALANLHPIRQAMKAPAKKRQGAGRGAPWYLSRGREVPPLQVVQGGAA